MANLTVPTAQSVIEFIENVENTKRKKDAFVLLDLFSKLTKEKAVLRGTSLIGFGTYHYKYESGREGDFFMTGFSPRKTALSIYIMTGFEKCESLLLKLGKHKIGKSCLYINKLEDINMNILEQMIVESIDYMRKKYSL